LFNFFEQVNDGEGLPVKPLTFKQTKTGIKNYVKLRRQFQSKAL